MNILRIKQWLFHARSQKILVGIGAILFAVAIGLWWQNIYTDPQRVFENMLKNNFTTVGYTRTTTQTANGTLTRSSQIQLLANPSIRTIETLAQGDDSQKTEYYIRPDQTIARIVEYPDERVVDQWVTLPMDDLFMQEVVDYTFFPMGLLPSEKRNNLVDFIRENQVYSIDYNDVTKDVVDGRDVYVYEVSIPLQSYAAMLQKFSAALGSAFAEKASEINPSNYEGTQPIILKASVDKYSHRLIQVTSEGSIQTVETYKGYGITNQTFEIPTDVISADELQQRLYAE